MLLNKLMTLPGGLLVAGLYAAALDAADVTVTMNKLTAEGVGESLGTITLRDTSDLGLLIVPDLQGLTPGQHGFHVHEHPDCGTHAGNGKVAGGAAGGHYDPDNTGRHEGPVGKGHLGDLPVLLVSADGSATMAMFAPRLQTPDLVGRALMVHAGGDNYADQPEKLGGGGARVACGVVAVDSL